MLSGFQTGKNQINLQLPYYLELLIYLGRDARKPVFGISDKNKIQTSLLSYRD